VLDRLHDLVGQARKMLESEQPDESSIWRAYVAVESAILDLKLAHNLEHERPPSGPKRNAKKDELISAARKKLKEIDFVGDKKTLLYDLRSCRNALKALLS
jgi:hypothetical protein